MRFFKKKKEIKLIPSIQIERLAFHESGIEIITFTSSGNNLTADVSTIVARSKKR